MRALTRPSPTSAPRCTRASARPDSTPLLLPHLDVHERVHALRVPTDARKEAAHRVLGSSPPPAAPQGRLPLCHPICAVPTDEGTAPGATTAGTRRRRAVPPAAPHSRGARGCSAREAGRRRRPRSRDRGGWGGSAPPRSATTSISCPARRRISRRRRRLVTPHEARGREHDRPVGRRPPVGERPEAHCAVHAARGNHELVRAGDGPEACAREEGGRRVRGAQ